MQESRKSSRREFLRGKSAVDALQGISHDMAGAFDSGGDPALELPEPATADYLVRLGRCAMACQFEVLLPAGQQERATEAALEALDLVDALESQLTVFRDDSEISRLNQTGHLGAVKLEPRLFDLLRRAAELHRDTAGAYDITAGPLSKVWGFYRRAGRLPSDGEIADTLRRVSMRHVEFDASRQTVRFSIAGVEINLGSIGKGYALDRAAELLTAAGVEHFLLHGGNSSVLARGNRTARCLAAVDTTAELTAERDDDWWIGLRHPLVPQRRICEVRLHNRALGTSGSGTQFFVHRGRRYGHILDPRTGRPTEGTLSTTVAAASGAEADALATAFYVIGVDAVIEFCSRHPDVSAVVMSPVAASNRVEVSLCGWMNDDVRLYDDESISIHQIERSSPKK